LRLTGPGWYFVDQHGGDFAVSQQVPFTLGVELDSRPRIVAEGGVYALWFEPKAEPDVELSLPQDLNVRATSAWGSLLGMMPLVSVGDLAKKRLSTQAIDAVRSALRDGATASYDLKSGQPDVTLGKLPAGQKPRHAFEDGIPWLVNERVLLPPTAAQVVGPITAGPTRLDVRVERGAGVAYRVVCADDMAANYAAIARGDVGKLPRSSVVENGTFGGRGEHSTTFTVEQCKFYVVVSALRDSTTVAALRIRA
jgi:hypothetical protein